MEAKPKYKIGESVIVLVNDKFIKRRITEINIKQSSSLLGTRVDISYVTTVDSIAHTFYSIFDTYRLRSFKEKYIFKTKEDLIDKIKNDSDFTE